VMQALGVDTYTWPYILTTWVALVTAHFLGRPTRS
jgi:urea transporter